MLNTRISRKKPVIFTMLWGGEKGYMDICHRSCKSKGTPPNATPRWEIICLFLVIIFRTTIWRPYFCLGLTLGFGISVSLRFPSIEPVDVRTMNWKSCVSRLAPPCSKERVMDRYRMLWRVPKTRPGNRFSCVLTKKQGNHCNKKDGMLLFLFNKHEFELRTCWS